MDLSFVRELLSIFGSVATVGALPLLWMLDRRLVKIETTLEGSKRHE